MSSVKFCLVSNSFNREVCSRNHIIFDSDISMYSLNCISKSNKGHYHFEPSQRIWSLDSVTCKVSLLAICFNNKKLHKKPLLTRVSILFCYLFIFFCDNQSISCPWTARCGFACADRLQSFLQNGGVLHRTLGALRKFSTG